MSSSRKPSSLQRKLYPISEQRFAKCQEQIQTLKKQLALLQSKNQEKEQEYYEKGFQAAYKAFFQLEQNREKLLRQAHTQWSNNIQKICAPFGITLKSSGTERSTSAPTPRSTSRSTSTGHRLSARRLQNGLSA